MDFAGLKTCRQLTVIALVLTALTAVCHINPFDDVPTFVSEEEHIYSFFWKSSLKGHAHTVFKFWKPSRTMASSSLLLRLSLRSASYIWIFWVTFGKSDLYTLQLVSGNFQNILLRAPSPKLRLIHCPLETIWHRTNHTAILLTR